MPDLRQLRAFVAVAEQLSFTRAGELLHLQQQSVSRTVRELERELGVELLERTTREVRLTSAGAMLLERATGVLQLADAAFEETRAVGTGVAGVVRVGFTPAIGPADREEVVRALRDAPGDVSVALHEVRPADLLGMLRARDVDLVLARASGIDANALHSARLRSSPMLLAVPAGHRLSGRDAVALRELDGERLLAASAPGTPYTDLIVERLAAGGAHVGVVEAQVTGGAAILTELARGDVIALVPVGTAPPAGVVCVPVSDLTVPLWLLWPAGLPSAAVHRLQQVLGPEA